MKESSKRKGIVICKKMKQTNIHSWRYGKERIALFSINKQSNFLFLILLNYTTTWSSPNHNCPLRWEKDHVARHDWIIRHAPPAKETPTFLKQYSIAIPFAPLTINPVEPNTNRVYLFSRSQKKRLHLSRCWENGLGFDFLGSLFLYQHCSRRFILLSSKLSFPFWVIYVWKKKLWVVVLCFLFLFLKRENLFGLQLLSLSDLEADHLNPFEASTRINYVVLPEFLLQGFLCALFLLTWHWFMFLLTVPLTAYHIML